MAAAGLLAVCLLCVCGGAGAWAWTHVSHGFDFSTVPLRVGVYHIHSPEHFLAAHAVCPPGFRLVSTDPHQRVGEYDVIALRFRTLLGPMEARVFSNGMLSSEFLLLDRDGCAAVAGRLRVERCGVGHSVRMSAQFVRRPTLCEAVLCLSGATEARVKEAIHAGYCLAEEDANLRAYRAAVIWRR